jgi:predicted N-acetyltransferase YhbS
MTFQILSERPDDAVLINPLLDRTFGFDRKQRTVYRLREGLRALPGLSFVSIDSDGALLGSIRYWPIRIGDTAAILLGPLAVEPALQGQGIGKALVGFSLEAARALDHRVCVVVGAPVYYRSFDFVNAAGAGLILPGPVDPERFQVAALVPGALDAVEGLIGRSEAPSYT